MGLRIKSTSRFGHKIATLMAMFALVVQPMYGYVAIQVAGAITSPSVDLQAVQYNKSADNSRIYFEFKAYNIDDANSVELRINRDNGETPYSVFATSSVIDAINDNADATGYRTGGSVIVTGSRTSGSWNNQTGTWIGSSLPVSAQVIIGTDGGTPVESDVVEESDFVNGTGTQESVFAAVPRITKIAAEYVKTSQYSGVYIGFSEIGVTTATDVELRLNRADGSHYSTHAKEPVLSAVNAGTAEDGTGGTVIVTGGRTSSSWDPQISSWTGSSRLSETNPVEVLITLKNGTVISKTIPLETSITGQAVEEDVFPVAPEITYVVAGLTDTAKYTGVSVNTGVAYATDITKVTVEIKRADDTVVTKTSQSPASFITGLNAGTVTEFTTPIVIEQGTYDEAGSSSWVQPAPAEWNSTTAPKTATVTIYYGDGQTVSSSVAINNNSLNYKNILTLPSTNEINSDNGWTHVEEVSKGVGEVTLNFVSTRNFDSCFEFRTDGDISQALPESNPNADVADRYPQVGCLNKSTFEKTFQANEYVEVRMVYGAEKDERFGWTRFNVGQDTTPPTATLEVTGLKDVNGSSYVRPGDKIKFEVTANDTESDLDRASNIVFKLKENGKTQNGSVCGSWHNGKFDAGSNVRTASYTMKGCNGGVNPADGLYGLALRVYDKAGNNVRIPNKVYAVDGTKPTVSEFEAPSPVSKELTLSAEAEDKLTNGVASGVQSVKFYLAEVQNGVCKNNYSALPGYLKTVAYQANGEYSVSFDTSALNGEYCVLVSARDNVANNSTPLFKKMMIDNTAPSVPSITKPTPRQWFNTTPIKTAWTTATDDMSGVDRYQVAYRYDDGHGFSGSTCTDETIGGLSVYCRDTHSTSRNHSPASNEQGGVTVWVRAIDKAGNASSWSKSVHYYYDHEAPKTTVNLSTTDGKLTVSGLAKDNLALNRVVIQLLNRDNGKRYGGVTTLNLIPYGKEHAWSKTFDFKALDIPEGNYSAHVTVVDRAGNNQKSGWTTESVLVEYKPVLTADYFTVHANQLGVGFSVDRFDDATKVEVALYDASNNLISKNVGDSALMVALLNTHSGQLSSPFYIPTQGTGDDYWKFGSADWASVTPAYAEVTVYFNGGTMTDKVNFVSTNPDLPSQTYAALVASLVDDEDDDEPAAFRANSNSRSTRQNSRGLQGTPLNTSNLFLAQAGNLNSGNVTEVEEEGEVLAEEDNAQESNTTNGEVLADEDAAEDGCAKFLGLCWYWWVPIVVVVAVVGWVLRGMLREDDELPARRQ